MTIILTKDKIPKDGLIIKQRKKEDIKKMQKMREQVHEERKKGNDEKIEPRSRKDTFDYINAALEDNHAI